jgi:hypothetical protein
MTPNSSGYIPDLVGCQLFFQREHSRRGLPLAVAIGEGMPVIALRVVWITEFAGSGDFAQMKHAVGIMAFSGCAIDPQHPQKLAELRIALDVRERLFILTCDAASRLGMRDPGACLEVIPGNTLPLTVMEVGVSPRIITGAVRHSPGVSQDSAGSIQWRDS